MRIWFYDQYSGELIPSVEADKGQEAITSPREHGKIIESIYSTQIEPPEYGENETVVFNGKKWKIEKNYRELNAWYKKDGSKLSITEIGVEPDGEYVETAPEGFAQPIWDEEKNAWREKTEKELYAGLYAIDRDATVKALRHECQLALESKYFYKEIDFKGKHVRADQDSQKIITGYIAEINLGSRVYPLYWITCENDTVAITNNAELIEIVQAMSQWIEQSIFACRQAKDGIDDASNFEDAWGVFIAFRDAII